MTVYEGELSEETYTVAADILDEVKYRYTVLDILILLNTLDLFLILSVNNISHFLSFIYSTCMTS